MNIALVLQFPSSEEEWVKIADAFNTRWQFPNCIGAIDGKHIVMQAVPGAGSQYYNYKGTQSIVLLAMVDANYRFTYVDVSCNGHVGDGGVLPDSPLGDTMFGDRDINLLHIPSPRPLPGCVHPVPFMVVGDGAFPLRNNLMKPYHMSSLSADQRVFNYRLSRARHVVDDVFSSFASRFRVFSNPINLSPPKIETIALAASVLHNYIAATSDTDGQCDNPEVEEETDGILPLQQNVDSNDSTLAARDTRDEIADYCVTHGQVPWQWEEVYD